LLSFLSHDLVRPHHLVVLMLEDVANATHTEIPAPAPPACLSAKAGGSRIFFFYP
jgi:hypothetical protein